MRAGRLDRRLSLQTRITGTDAYGQPVDTWVETARVWGELVPKSGGERFTADQRSQEQTVTFRVRYRPGIEPRQRIVYENRPYDITDVSDTARREELMLTCTALEVESGVRP